LEPEDPNTRQHLGLMVLKDTLATTTERKRTIAARKVFVAALAVIILVAVRVDALAQEKKEPQGAEIRAEVPALTELHSVIYQVWHTAWPEKDVNMLADLLPEIQKYGDDLVKAELPGILHEKQVAWKENTMRFI